MNVVLFIFWKDTLPPINWSKFLKYVFHAVLFVPPILVCAVTNLYEEVCWSKHLYQYEYTIIWALWIKSHTSPLNSILPCSQLWPLHFYLFSASWHGPVSAFWHFIPLLTFQRFCENTEFAGIKSSQSQQASQNTAANWRKYNKINTWIL